MKIDPTARYSSEDVGKMLGITARSLSNWRVVGRGPVYSKLSDHRRGRVWYLGEDVIAWLKSRRVIRPQTGSRVAYRVVIWKPDMENETMEVETTTREEEMRAFWLNAWGFVPGERDEHDEKAAEALGEIKKILYPIVLRTKRGVMVDDEELSPFTVAHFVMLAITALEGKDNRYRKRLIRAINAYMEDLAANVGKAA